jgi:hypothetical protein
MPRGRGGNNGSTSDGDRSGLGDAAARLASALLYENCGSGDFGRPTGQLPNVVGYFFSDTCQGTPADGGYDMGFCSDIFTLVQPRAQDAIGTNCNNFECCSDVQWIPITCQQYCLDTECGHCVEPQETNATCWGHDFAVPFCERETNCT